MLSANCSSRAVRVSFAAAILGLLAGCAGSPSRTVSADGEAFDLAGLDEQRASVVMAALSQVGTPYVYGGSDPGQGLDCSGLTQFAHAAAGVSIPRISTQQRAAARPVRHRPAPGDLVFFRTGPSQYHVGVMVDGDRFVHASSSKHRVRLSSLSRPYWQARYLGAGTYL
ncbi:MAG: C40 family peptidase [Thiohalocapsa sp.]|jgi:cell wall-associated NlpC family hydrolase|uniref:C40 family peptidase n=1 Tax=Thiohalocapsa sp. TaxID=2497641 RepID=UPI0025E0E618|nr:C40 family peptidase [Thiohalocapsa sp.]MCG6940042.1 C40 family peptidase [Thiohalocapsa sp.]